ncbi:hypothetical protein NDU88_007551 [Pleurodeles waltl]|uniref:Uncharacterized protein n=1 Tax=Pleurodeles waltl TaxID=8319 RepID=A0AAV7WJP7_PLEWA|nr:hypothetical protein NDU88_007551 [Pleurodeles waltl]
MPHGRVRREQTTGERGVSGGGHGTRSSAKARGPPTAIPREAEPQKRVQGPLVRIGCARTLATSNNKRAADNWGDT